MKRILPILAIVFMASACQKEILIPNQDKVENETGNVIEQPEEDVDFICTIEQPEELTKISLGTSDNGRTPVLWSSNDQITVYRKSTVGDCFQIEKPGSSEAVFKLLSEGSDEGVGMSANVAVFPYSSSLACREEKGSYIISGITVPAEQTYVADDFSANSFPMLSVSNDHSLNFRNLCGIFRLNLSGSATVKKIVLKGNAGEVLAGNCNVAISSDNMVQPINPDSDITAGATEITVDCGEGILLDPMEIKSIFISMLPVTFADGFSVTVTDTYGNVYEKSTSKSNNVGRSVVLNMPLTSVYQFGVRSSSSAVVQAVFDADITKAVLSYTDVDGASVKDEFALPTTLYLANLPEATLNQVDLKLYRGTELASSQNFTLKTKASGEKYVIAGAGRPANVPFFNDSRFRASLSAQWAEFMAPILDPTWATSPSRQDFFGWWDSWLPGGAANMPTCADIKTFTSLNLWGVVENLLDILAFENLETLEFLPGELFDVGLVVNPEIDLTVLRKLKKLNKVVLGPGVLLTESDFQAAGLGHLTIEKL